RHLINPPGQWVATATGPAFRELAIHNWKVNCDSCGTQLDFEFAVDASLGKAAQQPAAEARIAELGWGQAAQGHLCPARQTRAWAHLFKSRPATTGAAPCLLVQAQRGLHAPNPPAPKRSNVQPAT